MKLHLAAVAVDIIIITHEDGNNIPCVSRLIIPAGLRYFLTGLRNKISIESGAPRGSIRVESKVKLYGSFIYSLERRDKRPSSTVSIYDGSVITALIEIAGYCLNPAH
ncbi:hypothetical protein DTO164E3_8134 [Paecilomyces variotii]|nr:hypothetical protein DTO164E3_8134 [Paecilomyces variotii]KAJ9226809.1 hypothetical protein DTO169C6_1049 [Paecilomyces variotii]KAJ9327467.1 hypothetical protein DTO027B3_1689 [Paecilomyces variotii]KAJ9334987.1 hypothetical protein DTO027B5_3204 [Paecilomyces variotii]